MAQLTYLDSELPIFPPTHLALKEEANGLLAVGGNLRPETLLEAYSRGIFPWFSPGEPILWWSPSPRMALEPAHAHFPKSLKKLARKKPFLVTVDTAFEAIIGACAQIERKNQSGTWISDDMRLAYTQLHAEGHAHSVETWCDGELVGGLYGVAIGHAFFGESMFSIKSGASKIAFASLCSQLKSWNFELIDCQIHTPLLASFGAKEISRPKFELLLAQAVAEAQNFEWKTHWSLSECGFDGS